jgi:galactokinase
MATLQEKVTQQFKERFGHMPALVVQSPGRLNMIGEHTDYNMGYVLPAAIDKGIWMALSRSDMGVSVFRAIDMDEEIQLPDFEQLSPFDKGWANYVVGVIDQLLKAEKELGPVKCVFGGNIPIGSGLSSSAALENAICFGLNELFSLGMSKMEMVKHSQKAEHEFVGVMCGIMDQFTSMMGQENKVIRLDCRSLEYETFPLDLQDYELVLLNSNVEHSLASSQYNIRRSQCEEGVAIMQKKDAAIQSLRDASMDLLDQCRNEMSEVVYRRCKYIIEENERVLNFCEALEQKNFEGLGQILKAAQLGMKHEYEITCPEIDFLFDFAYQYPGVIGARMMGGGFGGCTLNIVEKDKEEAYLQDISSAYKDQFGFETTPIKVKISDGVKKVYENDAQGGSA